MEKIIIVSIGKYKHWTKIKANLHIYINKSQSLIGMNKYTEQNTTDSIYSPSQLSIVERNNKISIKTPGTF